MALVKMEGPKPEQVNARAMPITKCRLTAPRPAPVLSFLSLAAIPDGFLPSSFDQAELVSCLEDPTEMPDPEPAGTAGPAVGTRLIANGELFFGLCEV